MFSLEFFFIIIGPLGCIASLFRLTFRPGFEQSPQMRRLRLAVLSCLAAVSRCGVREADRSALIQLYTTLGGSNWLHNSGWDPDGVSDPCDPDARWYGVGCIDPCDYYRDGPGCNFGRITALNLRENNLTGSITGWTLVGGICQICHRAFVRCGTAPFVRRVTTHNSHELAANEPPRP